MMAGKVTIIVTITITAKSLPTEMDKASFLNLPECKAADISQTKLRILHRIQHENI